MSAMDDHGISGNGDDGSDDGADLVGEVTKTIQLNLDGQNIPFGHDDDDSIELEGVSDTASTSDTVEVASTSILAIQIPGQERGEGHPLPSGESLEVGRTQGDVIIPHRSVSASHCTFSHRDGAVFVTDNGSTNGTFVNREKLKPHRPVMVDEEDQIYLGQVRGQIQKPKAQQELEADQEPETQPGPKAQVEELKVAGSPRSLSPPVPQKQERKLGSTSCPGSAGPRFGKKMQYWPILSFAFWPCWEIVLAITFCVPNFASAMASIFSGGIGKNLAI